MRRADTGTTARHGNVKSLKYARKYENKANRWVNVKNKKIIQIEKQKKLKETFQYAIIFTNEEFPTTEILNLYNLF